MILVETGKASVSDVLAMELSDSSVNLRPRWWTDSQQADVLAVKDKVITTIKQRLDENAINIPFPVRTDYLHNETKSDNGHNGYGSKSHEPELMHGERRN